VPRECTALYYTYALEKNVTIYFLNLNKSKDCLFKYLQPKTAQERIHLKFWHPQGKHDDQLMALALACRATQQAAPPGVGAILP
jgi:hypothetical protein